MRLRPGPRRPRSRPTPMSPLWLLLVPLILLVVTVPRPALALCFWNAMCGFGAVCENFRCVAQPAPVACNSDLDCAEIELCRRGICVPDTSLGPACAAAADCPFPALCVGTNGAGLCRAVACTEDRHCAGTAFCNDLNQCVAVECLSEADCAGTDYCTAANVCHPRCTTPGTVFVQSWSVPRCTACILPTEPRVSGPMDCPLDHTFAEGYCIPRCDIQLPVLPADRIELLPDGLLPAGDPIPGPPGPPLGRAPWRG